jgi:hypothetical protein
MKKLFFLPVWIFFATMVSAQTWCTPSTLIPYSADMPGITRFRLNTIDRTSSDLENYPNNSYVLTGLSTTLVAGETYPVTIDFTVHQIICPDMNLRIWVDLNHDGQLDDVGETLLSIDHLLPSTYNGSITIPETAMLGSTRLRATAKMSNLGGHSLPTPCDFPADPLGYHGEMEDYDVNIVAGTGISDLTSPITDMRVLQAIDGTAILAYSLTDPMPVEIQIHDVTGKLLGTLVNSDAGAEGARIELPKLAQGHYVVTLRIGAYLRSAHYLIIG